MCFKHKIVKTTKEWNLRMIEFDLIWRTIASSLVMFGPIVPTSSVSKNVNVTLRNRAMIKLLNDMQSRRIFMLNVHYFLSLMMVMMTVLVVIAVHHSFMETNLTGNGMKHRCSADIGSILTTTGAVVAAQKLRCRIASCCALAKQSGSFGHPSWIDVE